MGGEAAALSSRSLAGPCSHQEQRQQQQQPQQHSSTSRSPGPSADPCAPLPRCRSLNKCGAISPRYDIAAKDIEAWVGRLLPSRQFGHIILTTSQGIMDHEEAR